jgi:hypothetical protein
MVFEFRLGILSHSGLEDAPGTQSTWSHHETQLNDRVSRAQFSRILRNGASKVICFRQFRRIERIFRG